MQSKPKPPLEENRPRRQTTSRYVRLTWMIVGKHVNMNVCMYVCMYVCATLYISYTYAIGNRNMRLTIFLQKNIMKRWTKVQSRYEPEVNHLFGEESSTTKIVEFLDAQPLSRSMGSLAVGLSSSSSIGKIRMDTLLVLAGLLEIVFLTSWTGAESMRESVLFE